MKALTFKKKIDDISIFQKIRILTILVAFAAQNLIVSLEIGYFPIKM